MKTIEKCDLNEMYLITALATLLGLICATHLVLAQQPQNPCTTLPGGTGNIVQPPKHA